jgi:Fe-S cluster biogenesis protein NfuA
MPFFKYRKIMETATKSPVLIYTEQTPNPESLKFVTNRMLYTNNTADFREEALAIEWSPLGKALFELPYVKGVYIANNFVTVSKEFNYQWEDIESGQEIIKDGFEAAKTKIEEEAAESYEGEDAEIVVQIKELIDTYVKPAVEMDGGNIEFKSYDKGRVTVVLQGSCSGCPSSTVTLKSGIEGMLKRMVPQVREVVAEMG